MSAGTAFVALAATASAAGGGARLSWSSRLIDTQPPFAHKISLLDVACPSVSLCVAVDARGDAVTSTNPTGGAGFWTPAKIDDNEPLQAIACPSTGLCAAVDAKGNVV